MKENIERYNPNIEEGLSNNQAEKRKKEGLVNFDTTSPTKSIKSIIISNFFTIFNLMNLLLALAVFAVGEYKNMLFIGLVVINTAISTFQEIHSKRVIDKLSLISNTKVNCIRNGKKEKIDINEIVLDDILEFETGNQIITDCKIRQGEIEVDESFITGESNAITKKEGDIILSGSFVISGKCRAQVEHIGEDNFTSKISKQTRYVKKVNSEIMNSLNKIIKTVSIIIIPVGTLLFLNQYNLDGGILKDAVIHTVAAIIGMIPEGLILLTSTVLAVSVIRLSKSNVLVQELFCIETLARVDTLCLDKTGTITQGKMEVNDIVLVNAKKDEMQIILKQIGKASEDSNATIEAIREKFIDINEAKKWEAKQKIAFSSSKKWSGISFKEHGTYVIGAPEFVLKEKINDYKNIIEKYSKDYRMIVLVHSNNDFEEKELPQDIEVLGFVLITDKLRENAKETIEYFKKQGVDIRIISGDNPATVSKIAKKAGVEGFENYIDCTTIKSEEELEKAVEKYKIFGRVTPEQKKQIVQALKKQGHTVAMTGDGVNDIIALKEADCSIAIASGSDAARNVSQLVLLDSNFASMPKIVAEGRRTINNLERSASLFLSKTIYSTILAILFVFVKAEYPFMPIQLSLISLVCIGIPSFILALEPNKERVKGKFIGNVISKSIPTALTVILNIVIVLILNIFLKLPSQIYSTICVILTVLTGFMLIIKISRPFNILRGILLPTLVAIFAGCCLIFKNWFCVELTKEYVGLMILLSGIAVCNFIISNMVSSKLLNKIRKKNEIKISI